MRKGNGLGLDGCDEVEWNCLIGDIDDFCGIILGALAKANISADKVEEVYFGNVISANLGKRPVSLSFAVLRNEII